MPVRLGARACRGVAAGKELANTPKASWRPGRAPPEEPRPRRPRLCLGPLAGDGLGAYRCGHWRRVPLGTDLHTALGEQPLSRHGIPFNPWSLLLEVLDDPRLVCSPTPAGQTALLAAVPQLGWVTPYNVLTQRALLADHLLQTGAVAVRPGHSDAGAGPGDAVLGPAQAMALAQMQWPRHIAQHYERLLSVPAVLRAADDARAAEWRRAWQATGGAMAELRAAYVKRRVLFNTRMSRRQQTALVVRHALEPAPGLVLNALLAWRGDVADVLSPHAAQVVCDTHFATAAALRRAVGQAWQLYDWLIRCCRPHRTGAAPTMAAISFAARHAAHQHAAATPAAALYAALCASGCHDEPH
ncbi:hypothetical protein IWQ57_002176 [Coemansia nantahalensis]|uniref:Uncharacterized protein n=1 Tax=Coemansia nantahalensis TaxID=2789366 RepID=A0ACC1K1P4_9FUNG|nr:hypothetical protein IWQ57_002176 [Coemansia nantahalensis]